MRTTSLHESADSFTMRGNAQQVRRQMMEFHVSRAARERYGFSERLFALTGNVVFADFAASRRFAQQMNAQRDLARDPGLAVRAGDLNAMGLIDEILHHVVELYRQEVSATAIRDALAELEARIGTDVVDAALRTFVEHFPPLIVYRDELGVDEYLAAQTEGRPNREAALEELLMLWLSNANPSFAPYGELFDDAPLEERSAYDALIRGLETHFRAQPTFGPDDDDLVTLLRRPGQEAGTLAEQLAWMRERWGLLLQRYGDRLAISLDVLAEETRATWMRFDTAHAGVEPDGASDTSALHGFEGVDADTERFSSDSDWMPQLVLMAKSTYVWLDQLAREYGRPIWRLDQIPDEELDRLAAAGFSGLWLIGLWERSYASQRIKQLRGNPEAVASAYSLMDYRISDDLGGEEGYQDLRRRAAERGVRLASDMVPNHMGIDSRWVVEHPEWFMTRSEPPYPAYTYNGPNLSSDERVGIYLEDHYYDNTDAAVTFKRVDRWSGEERHVYHGNDGTSMPWNDTAQLDYLKPEVREAVIQTILHVARLFPVIRFDAAMTLAKKHIQRLWYPEPGSGGAIPSRAEYSMSRRAFDGAMPAEFWREVVDRVAAEAPDTLLLAEAFWLMEGYFVRTLGMHRVYNSAFMNMMRDEKNAEYRLVMKNTLDFDPQILKRYVNFMNNPDERTAVDQFDKGDKYFGVCTLMVTMPGLPMFGHGQLEGFGERYGMEFRRPQLQEQPDPDLVARHEREIFPLLHRRDLFAHVDDFLLYDFETPEGTVNEDVFAYSNRRSQERSLIVYNNRFAEARGSIRMSVGPVQRRLSDGLSLVDDDPARFLVLRDQRSGLEFLRRQADLGREGLYLELGAYQCLVFLELRDLHDGEGRYVRLAERIGWGGVPSVERALFELELEPLHEELRRAFEPTVVKPLVDNGAKVEPPLATEFGSRVDVFTEAVLTRAGLDATRRPPVTVPAEGAPLVPPAVRDYLTSELGDDGGPRATYLAWVLARMVDRAHAAAGSGLVGGRWLAEWQLGPVFGGALAAIDVDPATAEQAADLFTALLLVVTDVAETGAAPPPARWLDEMAVRRAIGANEHATETWVDREKFERFVTWLQVPVLEGAVSIDGDPVAAARRRASDLRQRAEAAGYRLEAIREATAGSAESVTSTEPVEPLESIATAESAPEPPRSTSE